MLSLRNLLRRKSSPSKSKRQGNLRRNRTHRRLRIESLQSRQLLATDLAGINGVVYDDLTGNGLTNDDTLIASAQVQLYSDDGDGVYDSGDTLLASDTTDSNGAYQFDRLSAGTYHVVQTVPSGYISSGSNVQTITISAANAQGELGVLIDGFSDAAQSLTAPTPEPENIPIVSSTASSNTILGGERDLVLELTGGPSSVDLDVVTVLSSIGFSAGFGSTGNFQITYDGSDGDATALAPAGLGGADLTDGGQSSQLQFLIKADQDLSTMRVRVYSEGTSPSDATRYSTVTINIPRTTSGSTAAEVLVPFSSFTKDGGSGADFTKVGAIEIDVTGVPDLDLQISLVGSLSQFNQEVDFGLRQPLSLGNFVWSDDNANGLFDTGEAPLSGVAVALYEDTDGNGAYTAGVDKFMTNTTTNGSGNYLFTGLTDGNYIVQLPQSNFNTGGVLEGYFGPPESQVPSPNTNINNDNNGYALANQGVVSKAITLALGTEPIDDGDDDPNTNLTLDFGLPSSLDLQIVKSQSSSTPVAGNAFTYKLDVTNNGPIAATGVVVTDVLPANLQFLNSTATQGTYSASTGVWTIGTLAVGASRSLTINTTVLASASGTLSNTATVSSNENDSNPNNNTSTVQASVNRQADLSITKTDSVDPTFPGDSFNYRLTVTNNGVSDASGVVITDNLPSGLTYNRATSSQGTVSANNSVVTVNVGNLAAGATATVDVFVTVTTTTAGNLVNTATVSSNDPDPNPGNNMASESTSVEYASLSGHTYFDNNKNGVYDTGDLAIAGTVLNLQGTDALGNSVARSTTTDDTGLYVFGNLLPGTYQVVETQPINAADGTDTVGTGADNNGTAGNDIIQGIQIGTGDDAVSFNFGEIPQLTKRRFLASVYRR